MKTIREATYELLRSQGMTTIFGNPGSNELPFLKDFPSDFRYVLGLHEGAVISMADGYAQASGSATFVNLHAAAGTGNAMGGLTNAVYSHSPLVITAGQQVRATVGMEVMLANVDAPSLPRPLVKWSTEPLTADDVPRAISQGIHTATLPAPGPVYLSIPYDDWDHAAPENAHHLASRTSEVGGALTAEQLDRLVAEIKAARSPVLVFGPDVDSVHANNDAVRLSEKLNAPAWIAPSPARCPFPTRHRNFRGVLPASIAGINALFNAHDLVLVIGAPVFRYHQYEPGNYLPEGTQLRHITCDSGEAARAPMGKAIVGDIATILSQILEAVEAQPSNTSVNLVPIPEPRMADVPDRLHPDEVFNILNRAAPDDSVFVTESTSTPESFWRYMDLQNQGSFYAPASGGLGFGLPAAVGVQMAKEDRQVFGIIGDGSANFGITGLWTAAQYTVPVIFLILNNGTYGALRWFADVLGTGETPGLDVPEIDFVQLAEGYGVRAEAVGTCEDFERALKKAMAGEGPALIEVRTVLS
ncbi:MULTISPECIES: benzoylformate decarboxylase [unclassified Arthrobacter]|uniref:benzoylformate decarboxylase n=1 Tax=unclassified Arthrobacter TaxID=235627 RepID=UPI000CE50B9B|nr:MULTISPECIES: benzoylformate decarboxylase [unclassified Arthrobacter]